MSSPFKKSQRQNTKRAQRRYLIALHGGHRQFKKVRRVHDALRRTARAALSY